MFFQCLFTAVERTRTAAVSQVISVPDVVSPFRWRRLCMRFAQCNTVFAIAFCCVSWFSYPRSRVYCWFVSMACSFCFPFPHCVHDCFGDHLLGCSHGPMRIRRLDALVNILHHAFLKSNVPLLMTVQPRPGDISILIINLVILPILMSLSAALLSLLTFLPPLPALGWLLQLERWLRM